MLFRVETGFDEKSALDDLIEKYGVEEPVSSPSNKKRKSDAGEEGAASSPGPKKVKKTEIVTVEENRAAAEAIKEMADIYFKQKDNRKGGRVTLLLLAALTGI